jgi:hypothetical protein
MHEYVTLLLRCLREIAAKDVQKCTYDFLLEAVLNDHNGDFLDVSNRSLS